MKKIGFILISVLLLCSGCSKVKQALGFDKDQQLSDSTEVTDENNTIAEQELTKVSFCSVDSIVRLSAQIPKFDNDVLNDSVWAYITMNFSNLEEAYAKNHDVKAAFEEAGKQYWEGMSAEIEGMKEEVRSNMEEGDEFPDYMFNWEYSNDIIIEDVTDTYVTFVDDGYQYQGGAHGIGWLVGATFDKQTGKRLNAENILKDPDGAGFQQLLKDGLTEYFSETCDEEGCELKDCLFDDPDEVTIPVGNMRIYKGTFIIQYQSYEIAAYVYGKPVVILTFDQIKPFLTEEGLKYIK